MADTTTIKVTKVLRDRIANEAALEGVTAQRFLARLLEVHERTKRFEAVAAAYREADDEALQSWREETDEWATTAADGLDG
ncbi:hypothetical protein [Mycobacterium intracellulare]|uniref:hypothetical protein n=1 Tax=Mycobacterium intracellulare TaxID=1767 RepID=UPI0006CA6508|nr:hypothetical protein [Mycobacterium intracellulare]KPN48318.1 hypothetical protein AN933_23410 [Mycobacterium intracellulare subsp. chimaera]